MYPIHWFDAADEINYGFSMEKPSFFDTMSGDLTVTTDVPHSEEDQFSLTMDLEFKGTDSSFAKCSIIYGNIMVRLCLKVPMTAETYGEKHTIYVECNYKQTEESTWHTMIGHGSMVCGLGTHISLLFSKGKPTILFENNPCVCNKLSNFDTVMNGSGSWFAQGDFSQNVDPSQKAVVIRTSKGVVRRTFKFYDRLISEQQRLEDCLGIKARYLMDGFEASTDGSCALEHDVSGGKPADLDLSQLSTTLMCTGIGTKVRDDSLHIHNTNLELSVFDESTHQWFVNFWVYMHPDVQNGTILTTDITGDISANYDDTGYMLTIAANSLEFHINASEWYMLTIGCTLADIGKYCCSVYLNGELLVSWEIMNRHDAVLGASYLGGAYLTNQTNAYRHDAVLGASYLGGAYLTNRDAPQDIVQAVSGTTPTRISTSISIGTAISFTPFIGAISDIVFGYRLPTTAELLAMYQGNVKIDDRGTFYAAKLVEDTTIKGFGFCEGNIIAKQFGMLDESDLNTAFYDFSDGTFSIKDFKEL